MSNNTTDPFALSVGEQDKYIGKCNVSTSFCPKGCIPADGGRRVQGPKCVPDSQLLGQVPQTTTAAPTLDSTSAGRSTMHTYN